MYKIDYLIVVILEMLTVVNIPENLHSNKRQKTKSGQMAAGWYILLSVSGLITPRNLQLQELLIHEMPQKKKLDL